MSIATTPTRVDLIRRNGLIRPGAADEQQSLGSRQRLAQARARHRQQQEELRRTARRQPSPQQGGPGRGRPQL